MSDEWKERLQKNVDYFDAYRKGRVSKWIEKNLEGLRKPIYSKFSVPWTRVGPVRRDDQPEGIHLLQAERSRVRFEGWGSDTRELQQELATLRNDGLVIDQLRPLGYRVDKVLGRGGFGVACLLKMTDINGRTHKIVVKAGVRPGAMDLERKNCECQP